MTEAYWLDDGTFTYNSGGTEEYVAGIQSASISGNWTIDQLYTGDSGLIEEQKQHEFQVDVNVAASLWDFEFIREWLGGAGSASDTVEDTSDPAKFTLEGTVTSTGGDFDVDVIVEGITFEEMPVIPDTSRGEYMEWSPDGTGETITVTVTDNTAT